jgi:2-polyprenyl-3-methyl-5-hydroxy-6-metoxy-1,4-benzoquinol methylase
MKQWTKTPKHILRKKCIEHITKDWAPARFIEMGPGVGDITKSFLERGFKGVCYDIGEETKDFLRKNLMIFGNSIEVIDNLETLTPECFDYLFAFEVIEHIQDDNGTLRLWSSYLRKGGKILISVPAHMKKYGSQDESFGHIRRYEKKDLCMLLQRAGYANISILNYGFPLGNITRNMADRLRIYNRHYQSLSLEERSIRSGVERADLTHQLSFLFNEVLLFPFILLQRCFFHRDWGDGYVASGVKN